MTEKEREVFRSAGYAVVSMFLDESYKTKTELHSDPDTLEYIAHAWMARQFGLDNKRFFPPRTAYHGA